MKRAYATIRCEICGLSVPAEKISNVTTSICETIPGVNYDLVPGGINVCRECLQALEKGLYVLTRRRK